MMSPAAILITFGGVFKHPRYAKSGGDEGAGNEDANEH